jgi:hypothetical protein
MSTTAGVNTAMNTTKITNNGNSGVTGFGEGVGEDDEEGEAGCLEVGVVMRGCVTAGTSVGCGDWEGD